MDKALRDKGLAIRKAVLGEEYVNKSAASADSFNGPFQEILNEYCWGLVWSDERLLLRRIEDGRGPSGERCDARQPVRGRSRGGRVMLWGRGGPPPGVVVRGGIRHEGGRGVSLGAPPTALPGRIGSARLLRLVYLT